MGTVNKVKKMVIPILLSLSQLSCGQVNKESQESKNDYTIPDSTAVHFKATDIENVAYSNDSLKIENTIGFLVFNEKIGDNPSFKLYSEDKVLWYSFGFEPNVKINPYAWHQDYHLLVFRCVKKADGWYEVIVDEKLKRVKYISEKDYNFKFETWENHILKTFSIDFNPNKNPILEEPLESSVSIFYNNDEVYHPVKIRGEWLQIKWGTEDKWNYGWIKWREKNNLLIEFFYFA